MQLTGWGRYPSCETVVGEPYTFSEVRNLHSNAAAGLIARGNGRAYGDAAIGFHYTLLTRRLDRMISFDPSNGRLEVEAGVLLADILEFAVPRGFFPFVVPGTKFVTVGGMIAADIHGKNHHRDGGFGRYVEQFDLALPDGGSIRCSAHANTELFRATIGGMGLTGTILSAAFYLRRIETSLIQHETAAVPNLGGAIAALDASLDATYSVAWIDCLTRGTSLGRALIFQGEHARADVLPPELSPLRRSRRDVLRIPFDMPSSMLNRLSATAFNEIYFRRRASNAGQKSLVGLDSYFFPLDGIDCWNRLYGPRGFVQHQCVIPKRAGHDALTEILKRISRSDTPALLAVLKLLREGNGLMSFPMEGYTLALDFPMKRSMLRLLDEIDEVVVAAGGRLYLAKDSRQRSTMFERSYAHALPQFNAVRQAIGAAGKIESWLSRRLGF
jgi:decaprenylphospho-beta-D-ribofuranose 2-oxidase